MLCTWTSIFYTPTTSHHHLSNSLPHNVFVLNTQGFEGFVRYTKICQGQESKSPILTPQVFYTTQGIKAHFLEDPELTLPPEPTVFVP